MTDATVPDTLALARKIAALAGERRATDVVLLDVRELVDYTDYFVLATGQSARQNQAIAEHVVKTLKGEKRYAISKAGLDTGRWICIDLADVVFHVFDAETRARYDLELLWADAPRVTAVREAPTAAAEEQPAVRRRRVVRASAVEDADAGNAPDSERPTNPDEPQPEEKKPLPARRPWMSEGREAAAVDAEGSAPTDGSAPAAAADATAEAGGPRGPKKRFGAAPAKAPPPAAAAPTKPSPARKGAPAPSKAAADKPPVRAAKVAAPGKAPAPVTKAPTPKGPTPKGPTPKGPTPKAPPAKATSAPAPARGAKPSPKPAKQPAPSAQSGKKPAAPAKKPVAPAARPAAKAAPRRRKPAGDA